MHHCYYANVFSRLLVEFVNDSFILNCSLLVLCTISSYYCIILRNEHQNNQTEKKDDAVT